MSQVFYLNHQIARDNAINAVRDAPLGYVVEVKQKTRSVPQNSRMWAILSDISKQVEWHGRKLSEEEWKIVFTAALKRQTAVPNIDGTGFVVLGYQTKKMTTDEMNELQELMSAFAVEHNVTLKE